MELKPNAGSDRAWVWNTHADFADESPKPELLAIRFLNAESEWTGTELTLIINCCYSACLNAALNHCWRCAVSHPCMVVLANSLFV